MQPLRADPYLPRATLAGRKGQRPGGHEPGPRDTAKSLLGARAGGRAGWRRARTRPAAAQAGGGGPGRAGLCPISSRGVRGRAAGGRRGDSGSAGTPGGGIAELRSTACQPGHRWEAGCLTWMAGQPDWSPAALGNPPVHTSVGPDGENTVKETQLRRSGSAVQPGAEVGGTSGTSLVSPGSRGLLVGEQISASGSFHSLPCPMDNADWMSALCPRLWDVPLHHLSIPGSHDTMTYCLNTKSPISHEQSWLLQLLGKVLPCVTRPVVLKWSITQALNITEQLDAGVRYLDLRIAHMLEGSEKNLHFVHMVYTTALVEDTLTEISEWLESHPREVVILACRNFEGMTDDLHEYLVGCIKNIFGDMLCPRGDVPTLRQLWAKGQQVVLSYEDESAVSRHQELWPGIPYWWGNKVKAQELVCYLEHMKSCGRPGGLFVAGINLTENLEYVLVHPSKSLKKMTLPSLPYLCAWVREQHPGPGGRCTNIIAGDFIGADNFVSDVIRLNDKLLGC